jgi:hypothetical protein
MNEKNHKVDFCRTNAYLMEYVFTGVKANQGISLFRQLDTLTTIDQIQHT